MEVSTELMGGADGSGDEAEDDGIGDNDAVPVVFPPDEDDIGDDDENVASSSM